MSSADTEHTNDRFLAGTAKLEKMLALVPFSLEFDTMGLAPDEESEESDSESESVFRQEVGSDASAHFGETNARNPGFTPGPWHLDTNGSLIYGPQDNLLACAYGPLDFPCFNPETEEEQDAAIAEGQANGNLIAASTDLFAAISAVLAYEASLQREECGIPCPAPWAAALALCHAAIAKTKGIDPGA